ncbi:MAG: SusC/RagA family TonB-linked outer membrane protein [Chlorobi bacterium]|jgi:TonB-linked SusC/RagA family outer membrane protein|nr:SusC/RagA family TonB-linked outer membrane protein [Chlorobiota bacterium]
MKPLFRLLAGCAALVCIAIGLGIVSPLQAQDTRRVTGKVLDAETKEPLLGAVIRVKGTKVGTVVRRSDGEFSIDVPTTSSQILVVSLVGKLTEEVNVAGKDNVTIYLKNDVLELQKVVVTAVGIEREKRSLGYATQEISGTSISQNREQNLVNALVGKVAGVQINSSSGSPGTASYIRLRGVNSISFNNQPAFIVDGVFIDNSDYAAFTNASNVAEGNAGNMVSGVDQVSRILDINPDDIESINVLKGAAATSLYGLQAAAGAIVITTKKGRRDGTVNVQYSFNTTFDEVNKLPELQNRFAQGTGGQYRGPETRTSTSWGPLLDTLRFDGSTNYPWDKNGRIVGVSSAPANAKPVTPYDNLGNFFTTGGTTNHNLAITSGSSWGSYYFSVQNTRTTGTIPLTSFDRSSLRLNADANLRSDLKVSTSAQYIRSGGRRSQKGSNISGVMLALLRTPPSFDNSNGFGPDAVSNPSAYSFPDGRQRSYRGYGVYDNPYWTINKNAYTDATDRIIGSTQLDYYPESWFGDAILGSFSATFRLGADLYATRERNIIAINSAAAPAGRVVDGDVRNRNINADLLLTFNREITEDIRARLTLGTQLYNSDFRTMLIQGDGLTIPDFYDLSNAATFTPYYRNGTLRRLGTFFDAQISYRDLLYLNGSYRVERSTTLPKNNNAFGYGNIAASFVFSELLGDNDVLSFGKLRASYATVGSDAPLFVLNTPYTRAFIQDGWVNTSVQWPLNGVPGFMIGSVLGSPDLRPEKREEIELGLELKFLENRVGLDLTFYQTRNIDQILAVSIARSSGYNSQYRNAGTMKNSGIEAVLHLVPYQDQDWNIALDVNFSTFSNTVESLAPGIETISLSGFTGGSVRAVQGQKYGQIYGGGWMRDPQGRIVVGSNGLPLVDETERSWGSFIPDWIAGVNLNISYSNLSINAILDWKQGGKMWNGTRAALNYFGMSKETENRGTLNGTFGGITIANGIVQGVKMVTDDQGNVTYVPNDIVVSNGLGQNFWGTGGFYNTFNSSNTEPFVEDAGWIRLREVTISYRLPKVVTDALGFVKGLDVFVTGRNVFLSTKYTGVDPETSLVGATNGQGIDYFNNPGIRSYGFGIRAGF